MKALIDSDLQKRLPYEVLHGAGPAPSYSTQAGHPLRCYTSLINSTSSSGFNIFSISWKPQRRKLPMKKVAEMIILKWLTAYLIFVSFFTQAKFL